MAYCEKIFAATLGGHRLVSNRSVWRNFPNVRNERWHAGNVVLIGDALRTAHFSIGSGTRLAMEDAIALAKALTNRSNLPLRRRWRPSRRRAGRSSTSWWRRPTRAATGTIASPST